MNIKTFMAPGVNAIKENWKPIVLIQTCFLLFVVFYYQLPSLQSLPASAESLRKQYGYIFTISSIWIVSIGVPELAKLFTGQKNFVTLKDVFFLMIYYGIIGVALDLFYTTIANLIGTDNSLKTVAIKIALDQLVFSVFVSMPLAAIFFVFRDNTFSVKETRSALATGHFPKKYFAFLSTCWMYFGPLTIAIYSLPTSLNYPVSMAAQAAWGIILVAVGSRKHEGHSS